MTKKELADRVVEELEKMFLLFCQGCDCWYDRFVGAVWYADKCGLISSFDCLWLLKAAGEVYSKYDGK